MLTINKMGGQVWSVFNVVGSHSSVTLHKLKDLESFLQLTAELHPLFDTHKSFINTATTEIQRLKIRVWNADHKQNGEPGVECF